MARKRKSTAFQQRLERQKRHRTLQDKERIDTIVQASNKVITQAVAATALGVSERQIRRLVGAYRAVSVESVLHHGRGKPSNNRRDDASRAETMDIVRNYLNGSGPNLVSDELSNLYGVELPPTTVRRWMINEGLWEAKEPGKASRRTLEGFDLAAILSEREDRTVTNNYTFQYGCYRYQIEPEDMESRMRRAKVTIKKRLDDYIRAFLMANIYIYSQ